MITSWRPTNPRPEIMLRMWTLSLSAYLFKEPGSQAGMRKPFASISMDPTSAKHAWTDSTWACIDWYSHERHLKVLKGACLFQRLKFIHDWQPANRKIHLTRLRQTTRRLSKRMESCSTFCQISLASPMSFLGFPLYDIEYSTSLV